MMTVCDWFWVATVSEVIEMICVSSHSWKLHTFRLKSSPDLKVNWNSKLKGMRGDQKKTKNKKNKQTNYRTVRWHFSGLNMEFQRDVWFKMMPDGWFKVKINIGAQQIPGLHKQSQDLSRIHKSGNQFLTLTDIQYKSTEQVGYK